MHLLSQLEDNVPRVNVFDTLYSVLLIQKRQGVSTKIEGTAISVRDLMYTSTCKITSIHTYICILSSIPN